MGRNIIYHIAALLLLLGCATSSPRKENRPPKAYLARQNPVFICKKGNCKKGHCTLRIDLRKKITPEYSHQGYYGTYRGRCLKKRPQGKGVLSRGGGTVLRGAFSRGEPHGFFEIRYAKNPELGRSRGRFENGFKRGRWVYFDRSGKLYKRELRRSGKALETLYYRRDGRPVQSYDLSLQYLKKLKGNINSLKEQSFHRNLRLDLERLRQLEQQPAVIFGELRYLARIINEYRQGFRYDRKLRLRYYDRKTTGSLYFFSYLYLFRLKKLKLEGYSMDELFQPAWFPRRVRNPFTQLYISRGPKTELLLRSLRDSLVDREILAHVTYYLIPLKSRRRVGFAEGKDLFLLADSLESTVIHEAGHGLDELLGTLSETHTYWKIRRIKKPLPAGKSTFRIKQEVFAEDFRILFGGTRKASRRRVARLKPRYGDIRDLPRRKAAVRKLIERRIRRFKRESSGKSPELTLLGAPFFMYLNLNRLEVRGTDPDKELHYVLRRLRKKGDDYYWRRVRTGRLSPGLHVIPGETPGAGTYLLELSQLKPMAQRRDIIVDDKRKSPGVYYRRFMVWE